VFAASHGTLDGLSTSGPSRTRGSRDLISRHVQPIRPSAKAGDRSYMSTVEEDKQR